MKGFYKKRRKLINNVLITLLVLITQMGIGYAFDFMGLSEIHIFTVYVVGITLTAQLTANRLCSIISVCGIFIFNFFFAEPELSFRAEKMGYPFTLVLLLFIALMQATLANRSRQRAKQLEEAALQAQNEKLRTELLRSISHDLRTPLTGISGNAALLTTQGEQMTADKRKKISTDIWKESLRLIGMIENLLAITKLGEVKHNIVMQPELLDDILRDVYENEKKIYTTHTFNLETEDEMQIVMCNAQLISQVVSNLIDNAAKYTPADSTILLRTWSDENKVYVQVSDDGPGVSQEALDHIFEMFYTTSHAIGDRRKGFGIGLSLCKAIVEAHHGEISVEGAKPHGAVFTFWLEKRLEGMQSEKKAEG